MANAAVTTRRRRGLRVVRRLLLLLVLGLALPGSAQATWTAPVTLSDPGQDASVPQVAVDPNANAVFVWQRYDDTTNCPSDLPGAPGQGCLRIQTRARSAAGTLSPVQTLSAEGMDALDPHVAIDENGNAVFVWQRYDGTTDCGGRPCLRIEARARLSSGALKAVQTLSGQEASDPEIGMDPNGNAVFVWKRFERTATCGEYVGCERIQTRVRSAAGALSAIQNVHPNVGAFGYGGSPVVAVDRSGNAVFAWLYEASQGGCGEYNEYPCPQVQTRVRSSAGTLSPIQGLSLLYADAGGADVAVDPNGNAVYDWVITGWNSSGSCFCSGRIQARARSAGGTLSGAPMLTPVEADAGGPELGIDQSGNAVFVWQLFDDTCYCWYTQARSRSAGGTLSATQTIAGGNAFGPDVAVDPGGSAVIVWIRPDATTDCSSPLYGPGCLRVRARPRSAAGTLGPVRTLSAPGQDTRVVRVAVDQSGRAVAIWNRFDGANWRIQAAAGP
jgi:hypothetical protein